MKSSAQIAVLGAGPAAVATACGLRRLGHDVVLIGTCRNAAVEGMSERTVALLREHGLMAAAGRVHGPGERAGLWAGAELAGSREYVVDRAELDPALLGDAVCSGVTVRRERSLGYERLGPDWRVRTEHGEVRCRVVIDARGRRAQRTLHRGPELISVCQRFRNRHTGRLVTRIEAVPQGWCWLARSRGMSWLQVTSSRTEPSLRSGLSQHLAQFLGGAPQMAALLSDATADGAPVARAATATLSADPHLPGVLRAGDAALALDPLSGQGVYEALRSAHIATAAAHTFLATGQWELIERFVGERLLELWQRRNATAAEHYLHQARITPSAFWRQAASHYQALRPQRSASPPGARIEWRPVLDGLLIRMRRVVVTAQAPRGVWQVETVDLAELLDVLGMVSMDVERAARHLLRPAAAVEEALRWLRGQGVGAGAGVLPGQGGGRMGGR